MPRERMVRENSKYLPWLRAAILGGATAIALSAMPFYPPYLIALLPLGIGAMAYVAPSLAALLMVGVISLPVLAANFVAGALFLIVGFSATQYLGTDRARGFIVILLAALAVSVHAEWAVVVLAGYLMGSGPGAVAALIACLLIQVTGALLGMPNVGAVFAGGRPPAVLAFAAAPEAPLAFGWLAGAISSASPARVVSAVTSATPITLLVLQPLLWALGAAAGGIFHRPHTGANRIAAAVGLGGVTAVLAIVSTLMLTSLHSDVPLGMLGTTALVSAVVAVLVGLVTESMFYLRPPQAAAQPLHGMQAEDADVDELLRMISSAEDELASRHTTEKVVMLTDMKAFSKMTEEVGSVESAKLVQRQRDLLMPVIERHAGRGKSTGGDGLVAAFDSEIDAVAAAVAMQREIADHLEARAGAESWAVRIGIARGEVVLDKGGRPFIGAALNLAARIMDLGDGGQIMVASDVADSAGVTSLARSERGLFELKNIQAPVAVTEVFWRTV